MRSVAAAFASALMFTCGALLPGCVLAQQYPTRQITIVVPYPPGGSIDIVARLLQPALQGALGAPVVVENHTGAGGNVGAEYVARAAPDGYTLLLANPSLAISPSVYSKLNYEPLKDFAYIGRYGSMPNVLVVRPSLPVRTVQELIDYARKHPGRLNYGSPGYGTSPQLSTELFKTMTNTFIVHIPFRGASQATQALLAGDVDMEIENLPPEVPFIKTGKVRALAVTSLKRASILPDVPTLDELGLKGYEITSWFGLAARAGTSRNTVLTVNAALNRATRDPKLREAIESYGATVVEGSPEDFVDFVKAETAKFAPLVKRAGVLVE